MTKTISGACLGLGLLCLAASAPAQNFIYVANEDSASVSAYRVSPLGVLTTVAGSPFTAGTFPTAVAVDPHLKCAFASNAGDNTGTAYAIDSSTGALTYLASPGTEPNPQALAVDPTGRFLSQASGYKVNRFNWLAKSSSISSESDG